MTYQFATDPTQPHMGGNIIQGDPLTHSPRVWDYLIERFALRSVMDLGSGMGHAAWYFHRRGVPTIAVDGLQSNVRNAVYPTIWHDLKHWPVMVNVDLIVCVETVEHIEPQHVGNLMASLVRSKFTVMTHAYPGQAGHHHVNCQPESYWLEKIEAYGGNTLDIDTQRVRAIADGEGAFHLARSAIVFANTGKGLP